jgi:trypsin
LNGVSIHPDYDRDDTTTNNIAVLHLKGNVELTDYVLPGCLSTFDVASSQLLDEKTKGTVFGF